MNYCLKAINVVDKFCYLCFEESETFCNFHLNHNALALKFNTTIYSKEFIQTLNDINTSQAWKNLEFKPIKI